MNNNDYMSARGLAMQGLQGNYRDPTVANVEDAVEALKKRRALLTKKLEEVDDIRAEIARIDRMVEAGLVKP